MLLCWSVVLLLCSLCGPTIPLPRLVGLDWLRSTDFQIFQAGPKLPRQAGRTKVCVDGVPFHVGELVPNGGQDGKQEVTGATQQGGGVGSLPLSEKTKGRSRLDTALRFVPNRFGLLLWVLMSMSLWLLLVLMIPVYSIAAVRSAIGFVAPGYFVTAEQTLFGVSLLGAGLTGVKTCSCTD